MLSDGQWVVRQLELHPSKQYKSLLLVARHNGMNM